MIWNIAWILADSKNHPPMASMGAPSAKSPLICSWYSSNRLYLQLAQSKQIHLFSQLCKFWPINEVKVWTFLFIHHTSASSTSRMLSWPRIVIISKILVKDYPVVVDKEERFRGKTFCKFEHFTPGHKTLISEWFWVFPPYERVSTMVKVESVILSSFVNHLVDHIPVGDLS